MNAYELADSLETKGKRFIEDASYTNAHYKLEEITEGKAANMLRQQADRIAELEKLNSFLNEKLLDAMEQVNKFALTLATTPQTKPLTEEEVNQIIKQQDWFSMTWVDMVRKIEKIIYSKNSTVPDGLTDPKSYYIGYEDGKAQTKLSDEEIIEAVKDHFVGAMKLGIVLTNDNVLGFARAIEAKVRGEK
jgi:hypothetical protein